MSDAWTYTLTSEVEPCSAEGCGVSVLLELVDSGLPWQYSISLQEEPILALFDLNSPELFAVFLPVQYCPDPEKCSPQSINIHRYDLSLSPSATHLTELFELSISSSTYDRVIYQDSVVIGGKTQIFGTRPNFCMIEYRKTVIQLCIHVLFKVQRPMYCQADTLTQV